SAGCISRVLFSPGVVEDLNPIGSNSYGVTTCETCAQNPCLNGGLCQEAHSAEGYACICPSGYSGTNCQELGEVCYAGACGGGRCVQSQGGYECMCPFGKTGKRCEKEINILEPAFSEDAFAAYPTPKAVAKLDVEMRLKPETIDDSILIYCAQANDGEGDFTSLAIRDKHLEFMFDAGSGPAVIRSEREIRVGEWINVTMWRDAQKAHLKINEDKPVHGRSPGSARGLNLQTPFYLGGTDPQRIRVNRIVGVKRGFKGCVSSLKLQNRKLNLLAEHTDSANVEDCSSAAPCQRDPCGRNGVCTDFGDGQFSCTCETGFTGKLCENEPTACNTRKPCKNGGKCRESPGNEYECLCLMGYGGKDCEKTVTVETEAYIAKSGYIELPRSMLPHHSEDLPEKVAFKITTTDRNGLLFFHGPPETMDGAGMDHFTIALVDGYVTVSYELGNGPASIKWDKYPISDGVQHRVLVVRTGKTATVQVDESNVAYGEAGGILRRLNAAGNIYIGGAPALRRMTGGAHSVGLSACIKELQIGETKPVNFAKMAVQGIAVGKCDDEMWQPRAN
ncbi:unnamed protein product, partial [Notodromas monacha]